VENEAHISAAQSTAQAHPRFSGTNEHTRRATGVKTPSSQGAQAFNCSDQQQITRPTLPEKLRCRRDFLQAQTHGERFRGQKVTLLLTMSSDQLRSRLGLTVSRKVGGAVVRNRVRRRLREVCRQYCGFQPGFDYVVIANPQAAECASAVLAKELFFLLDRSQAWALRQKSS
jgi:ribonuclease P protein component